MLNILSIDWDYFINADSNERVMKFPDIPNENYPLFLQNTIWVSRYSNNPNILDISYNPVIWDIVQSFKSLPFVVICDSHKWIYSYINQLQMKQHKKDKINLLNIDFHSDYRLPKTELDCGNWLNYVMDKYKGQYRWLGWNDSFLQKLPKQLQFITDINSVLSDIKSTKWDLVFVCRSSMWSPPHLDSVFTDIFYPLTLSSKKVVAEDAIWQSRYSTEMKENISKMSEVISQFYSKNKKRREAV